MQSPHRRNRGEFQRPPQGEFRARAVRKSDDTTEKVQPAGVQGEDYAPAGRASDGEKFAEWEIKAPRVVRGRFRFKRPIQGLIGPLSRILWTCVSWLSAF